MLKTAIFSDIHANYKALEAILEDAKSQGVQNFACLGDIVGYGPNPSDCVAKIQEIGCVCVKGNHDEDVSNNRILSNLSDHARTSLEWTRGCLSDAQKEWLSKLPMQRRLGRNMLVHASLNEPTRWEYIRNKFDAAPLINAQPTPMCFIGHTHKPACYESANGSISTIKDSQLFLHSDNKYLVNVGSVGQSRDGNPKASYVIFNRSDRSLTFRRVEYDVLAVAEEIQSVGLSESLAKRLIAAA